MKELKLILIASVITLGITHSLRAAHAYAGLIDTNGTPGLQLGDALSFVSNTTGAVVTGPSMGLQNMSLVTIGAQAGLYNTSDISFTALSNGRHWTGSAYRAVNPYAAISGSLIQLEIVGVTGPAGAEFSFWDDAVSTISPTTTFTIGQGITAGIGIWNLTNVALIVGDGVNDGNGEPPVATNNPAVDPYGHLHGRSFTANTEGAYTVTYVVSDANGQHPDSDPFVVSYNAVPEPGSAMLVAGATACLGLFYRRRKN